MDYEVEHYLGPGEIMRITADEAETLLPPGEQMQICSFLWVYYGYPASNYEGINVETVRYRCGAELCGTCPKRIAQEQELPVHPK